MQAIRKVTAAALAVAALGLAGCSEEPSESDMRAAVEAHARKALAGKGAFTGFTDFRKQGCVESKKAPGSYDCYYAATLIPEPGGASRTVNGKARFTPSDAGMTFQDLGAQPR
ncbi:MAG TPA: hypothetical protein PKZ97_11350 [Azospirillaceae bacterium]|nr:hypothetical protein [Azospirillaceae bacterium]HRQ81703.1 hypothetical protein [Azospirillaceae bacterium]